MDVLQTKKRGGVVRLACKPHELVVVGSNPTPASTFLAVYWCKNQRNNVGKTSLNCAPFPKRRAFDTVIFSDALPSGLAASNVPVFNIPFLHGV